MGDLWYFFRTISGEMQYPAKDVVEKRRVVVAFLLLQGIQG